MVLVSMTKILKTVIENSQILYNAKNFYAIRFEKLKIVECDFYQFYVCNRFVGIIANKKLH